MGSAVSALRVSKRELSEFVGPMIALRVVEKQGRDVRGLAGLLSAGFLRGVRRPHLLDSEGGKGRRSHIGTQSRDRPLANGWPSLKGNDSFLMNVSPAP